MEWNRELTRNRVGMGWRVWVAQPPAAHIWSSDNIDNADDEQKIIFLNAVSVVAVIRFLRFCSSDGDSGDDNENFFIFVWASITPPLL